MSRRHLSVLVALAMVLVLIPATGASALTSEACPTTIPGAGFNDLGGQSSDAIDAIDCVAHYQVTRGTSATTFSPNSLVARWQMALFLTRMVTAFGFGLPSGADQGFTDLGGLDSATRTAINQIRQLGIAQGTSATTFNPYGSVARWEMALFLTRLLTVVGVGLPSGVTQGFTDIGSFDLATQTAINQIRQLGITAGTSATTYSPLFALPRWQMALFLARTLETGGAIPFRVSLALSTSAAPSGSTVVLTITVREPDGSAAGGRRVDVFVAAGFDGSGRCALDTDASINTGDAGTGTNCVIDNNDPQTNNSGVATVNLTHNAVTEIDTIYVWLGESGETFDLQDVRGEASVQLTWGPAPTGLNLPTSVAGVFGTTASVKAQLTGAGGAAVPLSGQSIRFIVRRGNNTILTQSINTGADGSATLAYVGPVDPSAGDDPAVTDTVTAFWDRDRDNTDDGAAEFDDTGTVIWDEQLAPITSAILGQDEVSTLVGTFANFTITVRDRFGQPVAAAAVTFRSASGDSAPIATNASGVASFGYTITAGGAPTGLADAVDARVDLNGDGDFTDPGDLGFGGVVDVVHYWVVTAPDLAGNTQFDLVAVNGGNNTIDVKEIGNPNYYRLTYDSDGDTFETNGNSRNLGQFESDLSNLTLPDLDGGGNTALITAPYSASPSGSSVFRLTTN